MSWIRLSQPDVFTMPGPPIALQINCGFARVAIKELTPSNRSDLNESVRTKQLLCMSSYKLTGELFQLDNKGRQPIDMQKMRHDIRQPKSEWHPTAKRMEYRFPRLNKQRIHSLTVRDAIMLTC